MISRGRCNRGTAAFGAALAFCFLTFVTAQPARADLTGELGFFGTFLATGGSNPAPGGYSLQDATGINFTLGLVTNATGDFSGLTFWPVALTDFTFDPFSPVDPLWSVGGFQFALQALSSVSQGVNYLSIAGTGTVSRTGGADATAFNWNFSGGNSGGVLQLFTGTNTPSPVSVGEPSEIFTLLSLMAGISALVVWSRKRREASQQ